MAPYLPLLLPFKLMAQADGQEQLICMSAHPPPHCTGYRRPRPSTQGITGPERKETTVLQGWGEEPGNKRFLAGGQRRAGWRQGGSSFEGLCWRLSTQRQQHITATSPPLATTENPRGFLSIFVYLALSALLPVGTISDSEKRSNVVSHNFKVSSRVNNKLAGAAGGLDGVHPSKVEGSF